MHSDIFLQMCMCALLQSNNYHIICVCAFMCVFVCVLAFVKHVCVCVCISRSGTDYVWMFCNMDSANVWLVARSCS